MAFELPSIENFTDDQLEQLDNCPWCQCNDSTALFTEKGWDYVECNNCELIYLNTRIKVEFIHLIYDQDEYHNSSNLAFTLRSGEKRLDLFGHIAKDATIFEDAAGSGGFLAACKKRNLNATGCDLGLDAVNQCKQNFDVDISHSNLEDMKLAENSIDYLAAFNLMSHLYEPWTYLLECAKVIKPSGKILIRTGDRTGKMKKLGWGNWSAPEHVFHFPIKTLTEMLDKAGLKVVSIAPAFDSDYPYFISDLRNRQYPIFNTFIQKGLQIALYSWTKLKLPKEDVYIIAKPK